MAAAAHPKGVRREATIIRSATSRRSGTSTQALLIQRFKATQGTGHGAGSRPQYNGGSTGRHGSKATHALSSQQAVKPTKPPPVQSTGGSLARRRPARPNHACVTPAAIKLRMQRFSEGNLIGTSVQRCPTVLTCTKRATFLFPEPHSAVGSEFHLRRTGDRDSDDVAPGGQRFSGGDIRGTPLRLFTVGRNVYVTGYFPVSRATFGCRVRISHETYMGPGQHLRDGITTGHPRQRWERMGVREHGCFP